MARCHPGHPAVGRRPQGAGQGRSPGARPTRQLLPGIDPDQERRAGEDPRGQSARTRGVECDHVGRRTGDALARRPQAEPTIGKAINGGYDLLETQCNRCGRVSLVALRALRQPWITPVWKLEAARYCEPCRPYTRGQRGHILGLSGQTICRRRRRAPSHDAPEKITFGEMRQIGVRGALIYCADYKCSHSTRLGNRTDDQSGAAVGHRTAVGRQGLRSPRRRRPPQKPVSR